MKTKMLHRIIHARRSGKPNEVLRLIQEAEKLTLPTPLYEMGADIITTVRANVRDDDENDTAAAYLLRIAYILHQEGTLNLAPPKPKRTPKPKTTPPEQAQPEKPQNDLSVAFKAFKERKHGVLF